MKLTLNNKTFTDFTNSAIYKSKKTLDKWLKYAKCMIAGYSIRKSAKHAYTKITDFKEREPIFV